MSAAVALLVNALHPRLAGPSDDVEALLDVVAASDGWSVVHLVSLATSLAGTLAIVAILWSMVLAGSTRWRWWPSLLLTVPVLVLSVGVDGSALKAVADRWAAASGEEAERLAGAVALGSLDVALLDW